MNDLPASDEPKPRIRQIAHRVFYILFAVSFLGAFAVSLTGHNKNGPGTFSERDIAEIKAAVDSICTELDRVGVGRRRAITWKGKNGWYAHVDVHATPGESSSNITQVAMALGWVDPSNSPYPFEYRKESLYLSINVAENGTRYFLIRAKE